MTSLLFAGLAVAGAVFGLRAWARRGGVLQIVGWFTPAAAFALAVAALVGLDVARLGMRDVSRLFTHDLGPPGTGALFAGLVVLGAWTSLLHGSRSACPQCRTWWGRAVAVEQTGREVEHGGHFEGSDWQPTKTVTRRETWQLQCRKCPHRWEHRQSTVRKADRRRPL